MQDMMQLIGRAQRRSYSSMTIENTIIGIWYYIFLISSVIVSKNSLLDDGLVFIPLGFSCVYTLSIS